MVEAKTTPTTTPTVSGKLPVHLLISHRVPLDKIDFAFRLATHPGEFPEENPLKIVVQPQSQSANLPAESYS